MLPAAKRLLARLHPLHRAPPPAHFADLRQRLAALKASLRAVSAGLHAANRDWLRQIHAQRAFSERFAHAYPAPAHALASTAAAFAAASAARYDAVTRDPDPEMAAFAHMHRQVLAYVAEIDRVERAYPPLLAAQADKERYQARLDALTTARRPADDARKAGALHKLDAARARFDRLLADTVAAQRAAYDKFPVVFKAALTAYWLAHEKHVRMLVASLEGTHSFAKAAEPAMRALDIQSWKPATQLDDFPSDHSVRVETVVAHRDAADVEPVESPAAAAAPAPASPTNIVVSLGAAPLVKGKEAPPEEKIGVKDGVYDGARDSFEHGKALGAEKHSEGMQETSPALVV